MYAARWLSKDVMTYTFGDWNKGEDGQSHSAFFTVAQDLPYFQGHFPGQPILPAMIILEISQAFLGQALGLARPCLKLAKHCKFKAPILPGESYRLEAQATPRGAWELSWERQGGNGDAVVEAVLELA